MEFTGVAVEEACKVLVENSTDHLERDCSLAVIDIQTPLAAEGRGHTTVGHFDNKAVQAEMQQLDVVGM
jgi:hypothetical protein